MERDIGTAGGTRPRWLGQEAGPREFTAKKRPRPRVIHVGLLRNAACRRNATRTWTRVVEHVDREDDRVAVPGWRDAPARPGRPGCRPTTKGRCIGETGSSNQTSKVIEMKWVHGVASAPNGPGDSRWGRAIRPAMISLDSLVATPTRRRLCPGRHIPRCRRVRRQRGGSKAAGSQPGSSPRVRRTEGSDQQGSRRAREDAQHGFLGQGDGTSAVARRRRGFISERRHRIAAGAQGTRGGARGRAKSQLAAPAPA